MWKGDNRGGFVGFLFLLASLRHVCQTFGHAFGLGMYGPRIKFILMSSRVSTSIKHFVQW